MSIKSFVKARHDQLFKKSLENPVVALEFVHAHLPKELLDSINTTTLKLEKETYIDKDLINTSSDVLFSVKFKDNQEGYIFLLLEHQSTVDTLMAFRLLKYKLNIIGRYLAVNPKAKYLPIVYTAVIYNGSKKYNAARNIWNLSSNPVLAKKIWTEDYQLINVHEIPDSELKQRVWSGVMEFFLKHMHERQLLKRWEEIADLLPEIAKVSIGYDYIETVLYYTLTAIDKNDRIALEKLLKNSLDQEQGERIMGSLAQSWKEEGIQIGIEDGIKIGEAKGIQIGEAKGIQIGEAKGKVEGKIEIAKKLLSKGYSVSDISELTGLPITDIQKLV